MTGDMQRRRGPREGGRQEAREGPHAASTASAIGPPTAPAASGGVFTASLGGGLHPTLYTGGWSIGRANLATPYASAKY